MTLVIAARNERKNLEKLIEEIASQEKIVNELKAVINTRSNEVIAFNQELKENAINQTQQDINTFTNKLFA